jgi:predicted nucleic acid-binding protein
LVVVDTSVWVDLFRGAGSEQAVRLDAMLRSGSPVALTDVVLMELLQGTRDARHATQLDRHLSAFPILRLDRLDDFRLAAAISRAARAAGIAVRSRLDYLIAAACVRAGAPILHADRDFDRLASCTDLRVFD